jgi:hypothetical protein
MQPSRHEASEYRFGGTIAMQSIPGIIRLVALSVSALCIVLMISLRIERSRSVCSSPCFSVQDAGKTCSASPVFRVSWRGQASVDEILGLHWRCWGAGR